MERRSLSEQAYDRLKYRIVRLTLKPGQWVTERGLAAELDVGLAPLRSAMARLSNEGLLLTVPRRGYCVTELSLDDGDQLFAAWRLVAVEITRLATLAMTPESVDAYEALVGETASRRADGVRDELEIVLGVITEQWHFLARLAGNSYLEEILLRLETQVSRLCVLGLSVNPDMATLAMSDRRESGMAEVFRRRDAARAVAITEETMTRIENDFHVAFSRETAAAVPSRAVPSQAGASR